MQTTDGKIVYLLRANIQTLPSAAVLPLRKTTQQALSSSALSTPLISRSYSEPRDDQNQAELLSRPLHLVPSSLPSTPTPSSELISTERKIREVEELEAKISNYKNVVEKYERLAEDATSAAIDERKTQLRKMEQQLRQREQSAKSKLANAINVMEESQVNQESMPVVATPQDNQEHLNTMEVEQTPRTAGKMSCFEYNI